MADLVACRVVNFGLAVCVCRFVKLVHEYLNTCLLQATGLAAEEPDIRAFVVAVYIGLDLFGCFWCA